MTWLPTVPCRAGSSLLRLIKYVTRENGFAAFVTNRVHGSPRLQIVTVSYQVAHPLTFCQAARCAHTDNLSGWQ